MAKENTSNTSSLVNVSNKLLDFDNWERLEEFAEKMAKSNTIPLNDPADIIANYMISKEMGIHPMTALMLGQKIKRTSISSVIRGKALGLDPITSIEKIHYINDASSSTGVDVLSAVLLKNGITIEVINEHTPVHATINMDVTTDVKNPVLLEKGEYEVNKDKYNVVYLKTDSSEYSKDKINVLRSKETIDIITTIKFTRTFTNGKIQEVIVSRYLSDYKHLKDKDNWENYSKDMLYNRVFGIGARRIANDLIFGMYENSEIADLDNKVQLKVDDFGVASVKETPNNSDNIEEAEIVDENSTQEQE